MDKLGIGRIVNHERRMRNCIRSPESSYCGVREMKTLLIALCLALGGCATKPEPLWEWCKESTADISDRRNPVRLSGCPKITDGYTDQSHLRRLQTDVGIRTINVRIAR